MTKPAKLAVTITGKERIWGFVYLLTELFLLPSALQSLNKLLPAPLSDSWLNILYFALNFIFVCAIFRDFLKRSLKKAGQDVEDFLLVTAGGFGFYYLCNVAIGLVIGYLAPDFANLNDGSIAQQAGSNFTAMAIGTVLLAPVAEELLYRGLFFGSLYAKNRALAYIISSAFFSVIHILGYLGKYAPLHLALAFLQYLPAGLVLAWAYRKSGSIFSSIIIHAAVNAVAILALR
ncbi:MAG: CPBP family intramembrane metalloprotease [Ruminococcaceae bacterium]|nr:CPBP family intramembrane metalloprotease [Oscillospiraceae bacterium]